MNPGSFGVWGGALAVAGCLVGFPGIPLTAGSAEHDVAVAEDIIEIRLPDRGGAEGDLLELAAKEAYRNEHAEPVWSGELAGQTIGIDRFAGVRDRMYSAFLPREKATGRTMGSPLWATAFDFSEETAFSFPRSDTKKGLNSLAMVDDAIELGAGHVVENIPLNRLIDLETPEPEFYQIVDGRRIGMNAEAVRNLDERFRAYREAGMDVTGVLLNQNPGESGNRDNVLIPDGAALDGDNAIILGFNVTDPEGLRVFRAAVAFLAERYTRRDGRYGWMSGLVIGNEIQSHWVWHNIGEAEPERVLSEYLLALRVADVAGRSRHPGFRVFASMTHHWTERGAGDPRRGLSGVAMLDYLNEHGKAGGDFPWGVAFHPYPENLFRPDFWNDRTAFLSLDAPRVTMRNIEVLDAFMARPEMRYEEEMRDIILSEQGFHGPPGPEGERVQAAALAYALEKVDRMPSIRAFQMHRHVDHPDEGGLMLGLWTHAGEPEKPDRKKKAWEVFRAFGTPDWERVSEPFLETAGLSDWGEAAPRAREKIPAERETDTPENTVADLFSLAGEAEVSGAMDFRRDGFLKSAGWLADSIMHHPPNEGTSRAKFRLQLPEGDEGLLPVFSFGTGLAADSETGVTFRVFLNDEKCFERHREGGDYIPHEIPLRRWSGQMIDLVLEVDSNGPNTHDWAHWVEPRIEMRSP